MRLEASPAERQRSLHPENKYLCNNGKARRRVPNCVRISNPYSEEEYSTEAEYIDPARIPFDKILSGPVMDGTEHNPQVVTAAFKTNAGLAGVEPDFFLKKRPSFDSGSMIVGTPDYRGCCDDR